MLEYMEQYCTSLRQDADGVYIAVLKPEYAADGYRVVKCDNITGDIKTDRWVTINGAHVLISDRSNKIIGGMGGKFNGMRMGKYGSTFSEYRNAKKVNGKRVLKFKGNAGNTKSVVTTKAGAKAMAKASGDKNEARVQRVTALGKARKAVVNSKKNLQQLDKVRDKYRKAVNEAEDKYIEKMAGTGERPIFFSNISNAFTKQERERAYQGAMKMLASDRMLKKYQAEYDEYLKKPASERRKDRQRAKEIDEQYKNAFEIKKNEAKQIYAKSMREMRELDKKQEAYKQESEILRKKINWGTRNYSILSDEKRKLLEEFKNQKEVVDKKATEAAKKSLKAFETAREIYRKKKMEAIDWQFQLEDEKDKLDIKARLNKEKQKLRNNKRIARRLTTYYNELNRLEKNFENRQKGINERIQKTGYNEHKSYKAARASLQEDLKTLNRKLTPSERREMLTHMRKMITDPAYKKQSYIEGTKAYELQDKRGRIWNSAEYKRDPIAYSDY